MHSFWRLIRVRYLLAMALNVTCPPCSTVFLRVPDERSPPDSFLSGTPNLSCGTSPENYNSPSLEQSCVESLSLRPRLITHQDPPTKINSYLSSGILPNILNQRKGHAYLVAIMDWKSRAVLSWELSNTMDRGFCVRALRRAMQITGRKPEIFNTDQGSQFTGEDWIGELKAQQIEISMDGKGRWMDNVFIERLWRSLKYEQIRLHSYSGLAELRQQIGKWMDFYNHEHDHQNPGYTTPWPNYKGLMSEQTENKAA